jgi:BirA family biotin operon repressor/biotin-[acetyl-CoA-carboxylase] ligase
LNRTRQLLELLGDGRFHSGEALGKSLGLSRGGVWKALQQLRQLDVRLDAVRGRGYRLAYPMELLDADAIRAELGSDIGIDDVDVLDEIDSTNAYLLRSARSATPWRGVRACLAERQTAGRGRRGRAWYSPYGANLYLSMLWRFDHLPQEVSVLSLGAGTAIATVLEQHGVTDVSLKWPNDVEYDHRKLAGVLAEMAGESGGVSYLVIGVGLNLRMGEGADAAIDRPWTDLGRIISELPSRNRMAADLISALAAMVQEFMRDGTAPLLAQWQTLDGYRDTQVVLHLPDREVTGTACGVDERGALRLQTATGEQRFSAGEISLRRQHAAG